MSSKLCTISEPFWSNGFQRTLRWWPLIIALFGRDFPPFLRPFWKKIKSFPYCFKISNKSSKLYLFERWFFGDVRWQNDAHFCFHANDRGFYIWVAAQSRQFGGQTCPRIRSRLVFYLFIYLVDNSLRVGELLGGEVKLDQIRVMLQIDPAGLARFLEELKTEVENGPWEGAPNFPWAGRRILKIFNYLPPDSRPKITVGPLSQLVLSTLGP